MRLISATLRNYRVHKELTLAFDGSRHLVGGPNETGKSTLAEGIHRGLFLRAKTGGSLQKEMVSGIHPGEPEVALCFEAGGVIWDLEKRFAGSKGSTRLTGTAMASLKDEEAEAKLAEILKIEPAARANANQLALTWSHLWVWQGSSGTDPASHASHHKDSLVQRLQTDGIAAVMQSATDQRVRSHIATTYDELFTATGKLKTGSKPQLARAQLAAAEADFQRIQETATRLDQAARDHNHADQELREIDALLPRLRADHAATEQKLTQVHELCRHQETQLHSAQAATATREQLTRDDAKIAALHPKLAAARSALTPAEDRQTQLTAAELTARTHHLAAEAAQHRATDALRQARTQHDFAAALFQSLEKSASHQHLTTRSQEAEILHRELSHTRTQLAALPPFTPADLTRLHKLDRAASQATATLQAMATGIELLHSDTPVMLDGQPLTLGKSHTLATVGELSIGAGTLLRISPGGGSSLAEARSLSASTLAAFTAALARHTLTDLDHAITVSTQRQVLEQKIAQLETRWQACGGGSLSAELAAATLARDAAHAEVLRRQDASDQALPTTLSEARSFLTATQEKLRHSETADTTAQQNTAQSRLLLDTAVSHLSRHREEITAATQALRDLETSLRVLEETHGDTTTRHATLTHARLAEQHATDLLATTRSTLAALAPDTLTADLTRFQRAIDHQETRRRTAENQQLTARVHLTRDGSTDPQADLAHSQARHAAARDSHASHLRRAQAIEQLHQLFCTSREAIDRSLVQPLADRIASYLHCIFGTHTEIRVNLSDSGISSFELIRPGDPSFNFTVLSGGAKEQVAAAVRLAMAEILATDHDGCLPILFDDAFAYADATRVQSLQRMLDLAARRGLQVIVLTCAPADYSTFGATETRLS